MDTKPYISQALSVISYDRKGDIRLQQAVAEKAFSKLFPTQSQQTNVPDDFDSTVSRLVFSAGPKKLTISQKAVQITFTFKPNEKSIDEQLKIFKLSVKELYPAFDKFLGSKEIKEAAVILFVNYPDQRSTSELNEYLYERFIKVSPLSDLASIQFQLGFKTPDHYFANIEANVYEIHSKEFDPPLDAQSAAVVVNMEDIPVVERGLLVKLDINSRPQRSAGDFSKMTNPENILSKLDEYVITMNTFMGFPEIKLHAAKR
jgi:hypothetical protein